MEVFEVNYGENYYTAIPTSVLNHFLTKDKLKLYKKIYDLLSKNREFINSDKLATECNEEQKLIDEYYQSKDEKALCETPLSVETEI